MAETSIIGVGSVGLSTLAFINQKFDISSKSLLFVKSDFEKKINEGLRKNVDGERDFELFHLFKDKRIVILFENLSEINAYKYKYLSKKNVTKRQFNIVGLGGASGDFFLNILGMKPNYNCETTSFCIMPFKFEGTSRMNKAKFQLEQIRQMKGECVVFKNEDLLKFKNKKNTFEDAFKIFHNQIEKEILKT